MRNLFRSREPVPPIEFGISAVPDAESVARMEELGWLVLPSLQAVLRKFRANGNAIRLRRSPGCLTFAAVSDVSKELRGKKTASSFAGLDVLAEKLVIPAAGLRDEPLQVPLLGAHLNPNARIRSRQKLRPGDKKPPFVNISIGAAPSGFRGIKIVRNQVSKAVRNSGLSAQAIRPRRHLSAFEIDLSELNLPEGVEVPHFGLAEPINHVLERVGPDFVKLSGLVIHGDDDTRRPLADIPHPLGLDPNA